MSEAPPHRPPSQHPVYQAKAELFRSLGHPARVRMLELLQGGEQSVGQLQAALEIDSSSTSQHLAALRKQGLVDSRKAGTTVYYRIKDTRTIELLALARQVLMAQLAERQELLGELTSAR